VLENLAQMKGHIKQEFNGRWFAQVYIGRDERGRMKYRKHRTRTKREAQTWLNQTLADLQSGDYSTPVRMSVASYLEYWLTNYARPNLSAKTTERYEEIIRTHLVPALGHISLSRLQPSQIQQAYADMLDHGRLHPHKDGIATLSARTVLHHHRLLHKALRDAVRWQMIRINPCDAVMPPRPVRKEMSVYDRKELSALLRHLKRTSKYALPVLIAAYTGMRRGEVLGLRWSDIDFDESCIHVNRMLQQTGNQLTYKPPKTLQSRRTVYMSTGLRRALRVIHRYQARTGTLTELVSHELDGSSMNPDAFSRTFANAVRFIGITGRRLHDLRHTQATRLLEAGTHPKLVQERLGHSTISTTMDIYSHTTAGMHKTALRGLDSLIQSKRKDDAV
jgi:integrase